jgi:aconitate hydratase
MENKTQGMAHIIVAGESYGQGSSREHAAMCPMYLGVKAVIARSFERIHAANLVNFGILPLTFGNASDYDRIAAGDRLRGHGWREALMGERPILLENGRTGETIECACAITPAQRAIVAAGGLLNHVMSGARDR